jgi:hypothetical protein
LESRVQAVSVEKAAAERRDSNNRAIHSTSLDKVLMENASGIIVTRYFPTH